MPAGAADAARARRSGGGAGVADALVADALVADFGGTHVRFAAADASGRMRRIEVLSCCDFPDPLSALRAYLARHPIRFRSACFAVAGPVRDGAVRMTHLDWRIDADAMQAALGAADGVRLINDCEAIARSVPALGEGQRVQIGPGGAEAGAPVAVLAPGTGLGVAGLVPAPGASTALATEGGHAGIGPDTALELALFEDFVRRGIPCLRESFLSGAGLAHMHESLQRIRGEQPTRLAPEEVAATAAREPESAAAQSVATFCELLGSAAGDQALSMGARGGVYLAGGVARKLRPVLARSGFRRRFENKGAMRDWLRRVPSYLITDPHPELIGAVAASR